MKMCRFLEEDMEDTFCKAAGVNIGYIDGADIETCVGKRKEGCNIENTALHNGQKILVKLKVHD